MIERLIEHWLDSIGERGYQPAFCQILIGKGHTIIHSTRHSPIEFGKDVISIDPEGIPCAFQLKAHPGSRLSLSQFREIKLQLTELVEQTILYPGIPENPHKCYLVTNGYIEEEVMLAIKGFNEELERRGFHQNQRIEVWQRGQLLNWTKEHVGNYWPNDFSVHEKLIQMLNIDGRCPPDLELFSEAVDRILCLSEKRTSDKKTEFAQSVISAGIFVALSIRNYVKEENHIAIIGALMSYIAGCIAASERYGIELKGNLEQPLLAARKEVFLTILDLLNEVGQNLRNLEETSGKKTVDLNRLFLQGNPIVDHLLWNSRALKTISLFSILNIEANMSPERLNLSSEQEKVLERIAVPGKTRFEIWGEGAIPQLLAWCWSWRISDPTPDPDVIIVGILKDIIHQSLKSDRGFVPTPYHSLEECLSSMVGKISGTSTLNNVAEETQKHSSYFAEALLHCVVRANLKTTLKLIWPELTRLSHKSFIPSAPWEYCLWRTDNGENVVNQFRHRKEWSELKREAYDIETPNVPTYFRNDAVLLMIFLIYYPHRAIPEAVRFLHSRIYEM